MKDSKNKIARLISYICIIAFCVLISGCDAKEVPVTSAPAISSSEGAVVATDQKVETKKTKTKKVEWLPEEIQPIMASDWEKSVDENEQYLFVLAGERTIVQIDKKTKESVTIVKGKKKDTIGFLIVEEDNLYYMLNERVIYQYNLSTGKTEQIFRTDENPDSIFGMQIYKNDIYIYRCGLIISKLDPKTKKQKKLLENVGDPIFVDNKLYYRKHRHKETIYCLDLNTGKKEVVRKSENLEKERFEELFLYKGKLCYISSGEKEQICMLSEQGRDTVLVSMEPECFLSYVYSQDDDILYYDCIKGDKAYLYLYEDGEKERIQLPEDYCMRGCVCYGYFFYMGCTQNHDEEEDTEYFDAYVRVNDE